MRAMLCSFGTAGDTQPVLALATEMQRNGHHAAVALTTNYEPLVKQLGLNFIPIRAGQKGDQQTQKRLAAELMRNPWKRESLDHLHSFGAIMSKAIPQLYDELLEASRDFDVLIATAQPVARMVHEVTGMPYVSFHTFYVMGSATELGSEGADAYRQVTAHYVNQFREQLGLPPLSDPITRNGDSPHLTLFAVSPRVIPQPDAWPAHYHMTGYFFLDEEDWVPDPALVEFMNAGESPVIVSFGSMWHEDPEAITELLLNAISIAGCRAIIQHGWSGLARQVNSKNVLIIDRVPHAWLFPRASCIVHHGGAGTTAATFRSGVPCVVVPHMYDQPIWANIAEQRGCAGPAIEFGELTAERLAWAIAMTLTTGRYRTAASALGKEIRAENGVREARLLIEERMARFGTGD
jgi:UDP:flavonoid glycosyltransferase YjiC (YdhE family)